MFVDMLLFNLKPTSASRGFKWAQPNKVVDEHLWLGSCTTHCLWPQWVQTQWQTVEWVLIKT